MSLEITNAVESLEVSELSPKQLEIGTNTLEPDYEYIKTHSIETAKQCNFETFEPRETAQPEVKTPNLGYNETSVNDIPNSNSEYRPLTQEEVRIIQEKTHMSNATLQGCSINNEGTIKLSCINEYKVAAPSEVPYVNYTITINDYKIEVVMPEFPNVLYETTVPSEMYCADDYNLFKHCTEELRDSIIETPELGKQFNAQQLEQIMDGAPRIKGLTWHHGPECGNMQLVSAKTHSEYRHTGGKAIWGGGRT